MAVLGGILSTASVLQGLLILSDTTQTTVQNTAADTTLHSHAIGAGVLSLGDQLYAEFYGDILANDGSARGMTMRVKADATPTTQCIHDQGDPGGYANDTDTYQWMMRVWISPRSASSVQIRSHFQAGPALARRSVIR